MKTKYKVILSILTSLLGFALTVGFINLMINMTFIIAASILLVLLISFFSAVAYNLIEWDKLYKYVKGNE